MTVDTSDPTPSDDDMPATSAADVAAAIHRLTPPTLLVLDCDGVLAPIVDHADDATLLEGVRPSLDALADARGADLRVAILSGRSLAGLDQFGFPDGVIVVGSYGGERRDRPAQPLDATEAERLRRIDEATVEAAQTAGDGAWVERKPASVVLHVRQADADRGIEALRQLESAQRDIDGSRAHEGDQVLELLARPTDKGLALEQLRRDEQPGSVVYLGDDVPDEDAFAVLGDGDLSVKVGGGSTVADMRLEGPTAVRDLLRLLSNS